MKRPLCLWALVYLLLHFLILSFDQTESMLLPFKEGEKLCFVGKVQQKSKSQSGVTLYLEDVQFQSNTRNIESVTGEKQDKEANQNIGAICYMAKQFSNPDNQKLPELGCYVLVEGIYKPFYKATNQGQFDQKSYYETQKIHFSITKGKLIKKTTSYHWFREKLWLLKQRWQQTYEELCSEKVAGFLTSVVLGDKKSLDTEVKDLFSQNGIAHILAVSGVHLSILGMGLYKILKKIGVPEWLRVLESVVLIILYGFMIHAGVATLRAIIMLGINLCSKLLGRTYDMKVATAVAASVIIAGNPAFLTSAGFVLSFMAILALIFFYPFMKTNFGLSEQSCEKVWLCKLWDGFLVTFSITFFLLPVQIYYYYEIYPYSMILNLIILPMFTVVLYLGFAGGLVGMYFPFLGKFLLIPCKVIFVFYQWLCERTGVLVGNRIVLGKPSIYQMFIFYVCVMGVVYFVNVLGKKKKEKIFKGYRIFAIVVCFTASVILCWRARWNTQVIFLDVGQGDCCVIKEKGGMNLLIDGGSSDVSACGEYRLIPYLKSQGMEKIDYAFLSHLDGDHYSAILEVIQSQKESGVEIETLVLSSYGKEGVDYAEFVETVERAGCQVVYINPGDTLTVGDDEDEALILQCLFPYGDEGFEDTNEQSMILYGQVGAFSMLFTGDMGTETEKMFLKSLSDHHEEQLIQNIDLLKVAHHGSSGSTSEAFLDVVRPKVAVISCGINNQYGHPHKETLERLENCGSRIFVTSQIGQITVDVFGGKRDGRECRISRANP